jgi:hypothetical protein
MTSWLDGLLYPMADIGDCPYGRVETLTPSLDVHFDGEGFPRIDDVPLCPICSASCSALLPVEA